MQNIIITGASRGIGYETAKQFVQQGHRVIAISRNTDKLFALRDACGERLIPLTFDLQKLKTESIASQISEQMEEVDVLINNAGYLKHEPFENFAYEDILKTFEVNVFGAGLLIGDLLPLLKKSELAHVVNISSMGGFQGSAKFAGLSWYSASKAAIANLTEVLAEEYKETGVKFNCLALGAVQTEMLAEAFPGYEAPLRPQEMANYFVDFALNGHRFFNGKVLPVSVSTP